VGKENGLPAGADVAVVEAAVLPGVAVPIPEKSGLEVAADAGVDDPA
jgi:hypothetical protein